MLDYRKGKERFKPNELGSLYVDRKTINDNERPIIYIGGQMEHRCHILEQTGKTMDPGHNMFNGSWFYDYPVFNYDKGQINAETLTDNFIKSLDLSDLKDVDLVTESFGGLIASLASKDERIHKIYAVHPPIIGTPLANPKTMTKYYELFSKEEKFIYKMLRLVVNTKYGFEHDSNIGIDISKVDLNKLLVIGSTVDVNMEKSMLAINLYNMIMKCCGLKSDGVVTFDIETFNKLGINYLVEDSSLNHFDAGSKENLENVRRLIKKADK